jgi:aspartyl-tRNA(Asn)/glutamyl-tRNA(Gln) amidotransferase subunit B
MTYEPVIGMEVHAELKTKSKMFCGCANGLGQELEPNANICPVCTGQPGSLPAINKEAVKMVIKAGLALNCQIAEDSFFERKNYFYPDLPKGYQISQYQKPLCFEGNLEINGKKIGITRIHLEEDTGKLTHPKGENYSEQDARYSLVDFNRAGVPLMELVTEPDLRSGVDARNFCQELQLIFRYLGISDADMEKGQMRCEVNISLWKPSSGEFGTKVEIKNLNSFKVVEKAIDYEIKRQTEVLAAGEKIIQETRGWDENKGATFSQRIKEEAHDYRYFPEPDLPPLTQLSSISQKLLVEMPELPARKRVRFGNEYGLPGGDIEILINNSESADYFEEVCSELTQTEHESKKFEEEELKKLYKLSVNYLITEIPRVVEKLQVTSYKLQEKITPENFAEFIVLIFQEKISSSGAQKVLEEMLKTGADPSHIIESQDLGQVSDAETLDKMVEEVIAENPQPATDFKAGKEASLQFLVGQMMKKTKGKANPKVVADILREKLSL